MTHIKSTTKVYYGAIILSLLCIVFFSFKEGKSFYDILTGNIGIIGTAVILYSLCQIFWRRGKIILTASAFKVQGYGWTNWDDLATLYPTVEQDSENGEAHYINFKLVDGTLFTIRSESLEMNFEQIAELVSRYRTAHNIKKRGQEE